jgi:hypothetical protein
VSTINDLGNTGGGRPPSAVINTNDSASGGGGGGGAGATFVTVANEGAIVGNPVVLDFPADTLLALPGQASFEAASEVAGIVTSIVGDVVTVQTSGTVELTVAQWAAITGLVGTGLNTGNVYYLSDVAPGQLVSTRPSTNGSYLARVGVALSATKLLLMLSAPIRVSTPIIAAGVTNESTFSSFVTQAGFTTFVRASAGVYHATLANPPVNANCIVTVTLLTALSVPVVVSTFVSGLGVVTVTVFSTGAATPIDAAFFITVADDGAA